jgi:hypothetical protein
MNWALYGSTKATSECPLTIMEGSVGSDIGEDYEEMDVEREEGEGEGERERGRGRGRGREGKRERERERSMVFFLVFLVVCTIMYD